MIHDRVPRSLPPSSLSRLALSAVFLAGAALVGAPALMSGVPPGLRTGPLTQAAPYWPAGRAPQAAVARMLSVAEQQVGIREDAEGGGTKFHSWYMETSRAWETAARDGHSVRAYANAPWCAMFVAWVGEQAGLRSMVGADVYVVTWARRFQLDGRWGGTATPGAVVFFDIDGGGGEGVYRIDHMGLVKQDNGDGTITTIEGNTDNGRVERRIRSKGEVVGYGYPDYPAIWGPRSGAPARAAGAGW
ncbi:CHAP domain-containing protein [Planomonospora algeriensis]